MTCAGATSTTPGMWMLPGNATTYTIPADATTAPGCCLSVMAVAGSGDLPASMDLRGWAGENGFGVSCRDFVDVLISP